ncbi:MAG: hypothetical protein ACK500_06145 [Flavobacteriales bacterium]
MLLLISDANILIDIVKLDLVAAFFQLPHDIQTTDFAFEELLGDQDVILPHNGLTIITTPHPEELEEISALYRQHTGISYPDASVWYYAQKQDGILVTGDGTLRKKAAASGIEVRGIIFILDEMKTHNLFSVEHGILKLQQLLEINPRLPEDLIQQRITDWTAELNL